MANQTPLSFVQGLDPKDVEYIEKTLNLNVKAEVKDTVIRSLLNGKALERYYEWILERSIAEPLEILDSQHLKPEILYEILTQLKDPHIRKTFFHWCEETLGKESYWPHNYVFDDMKHALNHLAKESPTSSENNQGNSNCNQSARLQLLSSSETVDDTTQLKSLVYLLLAEMCDENKERTLQILICLRVFGSNRPLDFLYDVLTIMVNQILEMPESCYLYVLICKAQIDEELKLTGSSPFADTVKRFVRDFFNAEEKNEQIKPLIGFIGYLYNNGIYNEPEIRSYIFDLVNKTYPDLHGNYPDPSYDEEKILLLLHLLEITGKKFMNWKELRQRGATTSYFDQVIAHLAKIEINFTAETRAEFEKLQNIWHHWRQGEFTAQQRKCRFND